MSAPVSVPKFILPGKWGAIDLTSEASARRTVRQLVERVGGRREEDAPLRASLRSQLQDAADVARGGGAVRLFIGLELTDGFPLSATLAVFLPAIDTSALEREGVDLTALLERFAPAGDENSRNETFGKGEIKAVRRTGRKVSPATEERPEAELIQADYWLAAADPYRFAMLSFTSTYVVYENDMIDLFDAIVQTTRWKAPSPQPVAS
ncbi:hypothetical protein BH09ACT5_BH09ACT5_16340 [soil metagenome]